MTRALLTLVLAVLLSGCSSAGCDLPLKTTLRWTGDGWEEGETCAGDGVWDSACD